MEMKTLTLAQNIDLEIGTFKKFIKISILELHPSADIKFYEKNEFDATF